MEYLQDDSKQKKIHKLNRRRTLLRVVIVVLICCAYGFFWWNTGRFNIKYWDLYNRDSFFIIVLALSFVSILGDTYIVVIKRDIR
jgi:CDP-diglyceride synthetase